MRWKGMKLKTNRDYSSLNGNMHVEGLKKQTQNNKPSFSSALRVQYFTATYFHPSARLQRTFQVKNSQKSYVFFRVFFLCYLGKVTLFGGGTFGK